MLPPLIPPEGPKESPLVVLGEAGGAEESRQRRPFVGVSGKILFDDILLEGGITRSECYVLNTYWRQPRGNVLSTVPEKALVKYREKTWEAIYAHPRKIIVAVGGTALRFLLGTEHVERLTSLVGAKSASQPGAGIYKLRGSPLQGRRSPTDPWVWFIPMVHPAALVHEQGARYRDIQLCRLDAKKIGRWFRGNPQVPSYEITNYARIRSAYQGFPDNAQGHAFNIFRSKLLQIRKTAHSVAVDIETSRGTISVIGLAHTPTTALSLPLTGEFDIPQTAELMGLVKGILEDPSILVVAQNIEFDASWLAKYGIGIRGLWMDTLLAHGVIHPETPHSLATLTSIYTDQPYYKDMPKGQGWDTYNEQLWDYNGIDCCVTYQIAATLTEEIYASGNPTT